MFHRITDWSDITVLQDDEDIPEEEVYETGLSGLLARCLEHPDTDDIVTRSYMTTAEEAEVKEMWIILNSYVMNEMPKFFKSATSLFHKRGKEESYY